MRIGDKCICKKSFQLDREITFTENKVYRIVSMWEYGFTLLDDSEYGCDFDTRRINGDLFKFEDYFYTKKELRKLKLEKIKKKIYLCKK